MNDSWNQYWREESNRSYWLKPDPAVLRLLDKLERTGTKDALDLGCGIGRHALALAKAGFKVTAVDSSGEALSVLRNQARNERLFLNILNCRYSEDILAPESFDLVLANNVLYHGCREDFKQTILTIRRWLKPGGLFYFTCPTRRDGKYGNGEQVQAHTYRPLNSEHPGDIHYFSAESDLADFLMDFNQISNTVDEHYWDNRGIQQFSSYWQVLAIR